MKTCYYVTVLSNFARGFDKYTDTYDKKRLPESTFPDRFYLLFRDQLQIGIDKASRLLEKLSIEGDELVVLETNAPCESLHANTRNGLGQYVMGSSIKVVGLHRIASAADIREGYQLESITVEDAIAASLGLLLDQMQPYHELAPRTLSVLPIAKGCQASCPFCFSEASASAVQEQAELDRWSIEEFALAAAERGAERFVITGGGEPGLVKHQRLLEMIDVGKRSLGKVVLITNGHHLSKLTEPERVNRLNGYAQAGLHVLAVSRHHHDDDINARLMNLNIDTGSLARTCATNVSGAERVRMRLICVIQTGGIDSPEQISAYLDWASSLGVEEVCFKELYVSTSTESIFHSYAANRWSREHRVPLSMVVDFALASGFSQYTKLPWGSPVFSGRWRGRPMKVAAYTEPSLFWERSNGIARSWNLMSSGKCLVSLEDRDSELLIEQAAA